MKCYISNDGEVLLKAKEVYNFLGVIMKHIILSNDYDEEETGYFMEQTHQLLKDVDYYNKDDLICLYENQMSGFYMIDNERINNIKEEMKEKGIDFDYD